MKNFKLIATYTYPSEYAVLQLLFQQEKIRYIFQNETMVSVLPFHSNAVGGIRLWVHKEDSSRAKQILNHLENPSNLKIV